MGVMTPVLFGVSHVGAGRYANGQQNDNGPMVGPFRRRYLFITECCVQEKLLFIDAKITLNC